MQPSQAGEGIDIVWLFKDKARLLVSGPAGSNASMLE